MKLIRILITIILVALFVGTVCFARSFPAWAYMWSIALGMYMIFKWITLAYSKDVKIVSIGSLIYLVGWVGMDPSPFQSSTPRNSIWDHSVLFKGLRNFFFGLGLIYSLGFMEAFPDLVKAWIFCVGIVMVLHFGSFHLLAWFWKGIGYNVEPIMKFPLATKTVAEFWGGRWNMAFKQLVHPFLFSPLKNKFGPMWGVLGTFLVSGLIHELAISLPANGGWGLPTLYFLIQALGMLVEKMNLAWLPQRVFTYVILLGPAFILFHPQFMKSVILPLASFLGVLN